MESCLGDYYGTMIPTFLTKKREDANQANEAVMTLKTCRLMVFQEPDKKDTLQAGTIKSLTGQDTISARANYGRQEKFRPRNKCLLVCNEIPDVSESTLAFWRRFRVTHFPTEFVDHPTAPHQRKIDYHLTEKLEAAAPYFIGILIHYLKLYKAEGLVTPVAVISATNKYKDSVDKVKEFVEERLTRDVDDERILEWTEVSAAYARQYGKMKREALQTELAKHGVTYMNSSVGGQKFKGFLGWRLN